MQPAILQERCHKAHRIQSIFGAVNSIIPTPPTTTHPNWKLDPLLKHAMRVSKEVIVVGQNISVDEQYLGFQGSRKDKQRITYKKEGDGFLVLMVLLLIGILEIKWHRSIVPTRVVSHHCMQDV